MCVPQTRRQFLGAFANWVLENNSIEFEGVKHHQVIGTAMGTIFSVMFANIFMLWLETPIVEKYKESIESYKRFLDDIFCAWKGSKEKLCLFKKEINLAHPNIKFTWSRYNQTDGYDLSTFQDKAHVSVDFMDVTISLSDKPTKNISREGEMQIANLFHFRIYRKKCNAYAYIPFDSFHPKHNRLGWFRGEVLRMLIRCSVIEEWLEECKTFTTLVISRGHRWQELNQVLSEIKCSQRKELLEKALFKHKRKDSFFEQYNAFFSVNSKNTKMERNKTVVRS